MSILDKPGSTVRIGHSDVWIGLSEHPRSMSYVEVRGRSLRTRISEVKRVGDWHCTKVYAYNIHGGRVIWSANLYAPKKWGRYIPTDDTLGILLPPCELYRYTVFTDFSLWFWTHPARCISFERIVADVERFSGQSNSLVRHESQFGGGDKTEVSRRSMSGLKSYVESMRGSKDGQ